MALEPLPKIGLTTSPLQVDFVDPILGSPYIALFASLTLPP